MNEKLNYSFIIRHLIIKFFAIECIIKTSTMKYCLLGVFFVTMVSCKPAPNPKIDFLNWARKGTIINNVVCKNDQSLSYCLYLPDNYNIKRTWPIIFCFDPKGDGMLPVSLFKESAQKYGYIVAASNNCKNGLQIQEIEHITDILFSDANEKISINPNRIYLAGFSGGARVACSIAFNNSAIMGVIACSAGFDRSANQSNFDFIGIAGNEDMNYLEMKQLEQSMSIWNGKHQLIIFNGKHQWPPKETLTQALLSLELFAIKDKMIDTNKVTINDFLLEETARINQFEISNNIDSVAQALCLIDNTIYTLTGLIDTSVLMTRRYTLMQNTNLGKYLQKENIVESAEAQKQMEYSKAFSIESINWWKYELNNLKKKEATAKFYVEQLSAKRLLAYISLMSYSYVNATISQENWKAAAQYLQIYGIVDPDNPDYYYFLTCYLANTGNSQEAIMTLRKSLKLGFNDHFKLVNDPLLDKLRALPDFGDLIK